AEKRRVLRFDPLPRLNRRGVVALLRFEIAEDHRRPCAKLVFGERLLDIFSGFVGLRAQQRGLRELAVVMRDLLEVGTLRQRLHAYRAAVLALPAKQIAKREMQVDGLWIDLDDFDERLDGLVGLLVEQKIESPEIRERQRAGFAQQMADVDARRDPPQPEEKRG